MAKESPTIQGFLQSLDSSCGLVRVAPPLYAKQVSGFRGAQILRLARAGLTEFVHMLWFDDMEAVRALAGNDYERPLLSLKAQALLRRSDRKPEHYEVREKTLAA